MQADEASNSQQELLADPQLALMLDEEVGSSLEASQGGEEESEKLIQEVRFAITTTVRQASA
jgi:hypothetical protein